MGGSLMTSTVNLKKAPVKPLPKYQHRQSVQEHKARLQMATLELWRYMEASHAA
jgi:hypothetical protein